MKQENGPTIRRTSLLQDAFYDFAYRIGRVLETFSLVLMICDGFMIVLGQARTEWEGQVVLN